MKTPSPNIRILLALSLGFLLSSLGCQSDWNSSSQHLLASTKPSEASAGWGFADPPMPRFKPILVKQDRAQAKKRKASSPSPRPRPKPRKATKDFPPVSLSTERLAVRKSARLSQSHRRWAGKVGRYYGQGRKFLLMIQTDKPLYQPGETIWVRAVAVRRKGNTTLQQTGSAIYQLKGPRGQTIRKATVPVYAGHSQYAFRLWQSLPGGEYQLHIEHQQTKASSIKKLVVQTYQPPRVKKKLRFLRKGYGAGDTVHATIRVKRATGEPLSQQKLNVQARLNDKVIRRWQVTTAKNGEAILSFKLPDKLQTDDGLLVVQVRVGSITESITRPIPLKTRNIKVGFFPEGGQAVLGLPSRVYFASRRKRDDKPQDIEGVIVDESGAVVTRYRSFHDGMGRFLYTPQKNQKYYLQINKPAGITQKFPLPAAKARGITFQWVDDFNSQHKDLKLLVHSHKSRRVVFAAMQYETLVGHAPFRLRKGSQVLTLPLEKQWRGVVRVTMFDAQYREPLAERLLFRHRGKGLQMQITTDQKSYQPQQTVNLKVRVLTPDRKPLKGARLGISVVDDTVLSYADDHEPEFLAQRYLTTQLTGKIHKPNFYFDPKEATASRALDLVMGTHGWRDFDWKQIKKSRPPRPIPKLTHDEPRPLDRLQWTYRIDVQPTVVALQNPDPASPTAGQKKPSAKQESADKSEAKADNKRLERSVILKALGKTERPKASYRKDKNASGLWGLLQGGSRLGTGKGYGTFGRGGLGIRGYGRGGGSRSGRRWGALIGRTGRVYGTGGLGYRGRRRRRSRVSPGVYRSTRRFSRSRFNRRRYRIFGTTGIPWRYRGRRWRRINPRVRQGQVRLQGSLSKEIIRRVVRRYTNHLTYLYHKALLRDPSLRGRLTVKFVINSAGRVIQASIDESTLQHSRMESRILRSLRRWRFPAPRGGGVVVVKYPFYFAPSRNYRPSSTYFRWSYPRRFPVLFYKQAKPGAIVRKDFRETVFWHPHLTTDAWGEARVSFGLNDKVTSFRVKVAGLGQGYLGSHEHVIQSKRPFFATVKMPLAVSSGDAMVLPVSLHNDSSKPVKIQVQAGLSGHFKLQEDPLPQAVTLAPRQSRTYFYPIRVVAQSGQGTIAIVAKGRGFSDIVRRHIRLKARGYPRAGSWSGILQPNKPKEFVLQLPEKFGDLRGQLFVDIDPMKRWERSLQSMIREPHGCFEQTSSTNYPNILVLRYLKSRGISNPRLFRRAYGKLHRGYQRLLRFESEGGGFEWFGKNPAHEALTAYGVLQLTEMKSVYPDVSQAVIQRTRQWLLSRRDRKGGYHQSLRSRFGFRAGPRINNVYITYALAMTGVKGLDREVTFAAQEALSSNDAYLLALALQAHHKVKGGQHSTTRELREQLLQQRGKDGAFHSNGTSITRSFGTNLFLETTALAVLAMLQQDISYAEIRPSIRWMLRHRNSYGGFGTTQATVLVLQALTAWEERYPTKAPTGLLQMYLDDKLLHSQKFDASTAKTQNPQGYQSYQGFLKHLKKGKNTVRLVWKSTTPLPYGLGINYYTYHPSSHKDVAVTVKTTLAKHTLRMGEVVRLEANIQNTTQRHLPMTIARIAIPGALQWQSWQLKQLKQKGMIDFYETGPRTLTVYLRSMKANETKKLSLDLVARVTGNYTGPPSSAYLYYTNDQKHWEAPLYVSVRP